MERMPITPQGYEKLRQQHQHLKTVVRPENIKDIEEARSHGDLSENAEYHAAKEKQGLIAAQLSHLEDKLRRAEVVDPKTIKIKDKIVFGATVTLYDQDSAEEITYQIVGDDEANVAEKKIGVSSPIAKALLGKNEGQEVSARAPKGVRHFEVVTVQYC